MYLVLLIESDVILALKSICESMLVIQKFEFDRDMYKVEIVIQWSDEEMTVIHETKYV